MTGSRGEGRERQRGGGYQQIAAGAVDDGEKDFAPRAGPPDRVERLLDRFLREVACRRKKQIDKNRMGSRSRLARHPAHNRTARSRRALVTTRTELMLMAALAIIGLSSKPTAG